MESKLGKIQKRPLKELGIDQRDLDVYMSMGLIVSGPQIELIRLRVLIEELDTLKKVHAQIGTRDLAIIKKKDWEEFKLWKRDKRKR